MEIVTFSNITKVSLNIEENKINRYCKMETRRDRRREGDGPSDRVTDRHQQDHEANEHILDSRQKDGNSKQRNR